MPISSMPLWPGGRLSQRLQANDCYLASCASYASLTGPNMSGKSTYLRQIALIVVMAHMGCYVPASFAHVRLVDGIFSRMGAGESIEHSSSSFMVEMQVQGLGFRVYASSVRGTYSH